VLSHCWLGHLTCKNPSPMTYNVFGETLNLAQSILPSYINVSSLSVFVWQTDRRSDRHLNATNSSGFTQLICHACNKHTCRRYIQLDQVINKHKKNSNVSRVHQLPCTACWARFVSFRNGCVNALWIRLACKSNNYVQTFIYLLVSQSQTMESFGSEWTMLLWWQTVQMSVSAVYSLILQHSGTFVQFRPHNDPGATNDSLCWYRWESDLGRLD